jgi:hypothetical protein
MRISLGDGKYEYVLDNDRQFVLRYGELWKDLTGDKFTYLMAARISELEEQLRLAKETHE